MKKRLILLLFIILNLATIFCFSHQNGTQSSAVSNAISRRIEVKTPDYETKNQGERNLLHNHTQRYLRQGAHVILFFTLGVLVLLFFGTFPLRWYVRASLTLVFGFLCAIGDEFHQTLVPGRTAQWSDIDRDLQGIVFGIALILLIQLVTAMVTKYQKKTVNAEK